MFVDLSWARTAESIRVAIFILTSHFLKSNKSKSYKKRLALGVNVKFVRGGGR